MGDGIWILQLKIKHPWEWVSYIIGWECLNLK